MEGFQLDGQKQWNVYTKSFLQFGIDTARQRYLITLVDNFINDNLNNQRFKYKDIVKTFLLNRKPNESCEIYLISTSQFGILSHFDCLKKGTGGKVLLKIS